MKHIAFCVCSISYGMDKMSHYVHSGLGIMCLTDTHTHTHWYWLIHLFVILLNNTHFSMHNNASVNDGWSMFVLAAQSVRVIMGFRDQVKWLCTICCDRKMLADYRALHSMCMACCRCVHGLRELWLLISMCQYIVPHQLASGIRDPHTRAPLRPTGWLYAENQLDEQTLTHSVSIYCMRGRTCAIISRIHIFDNMCLTTAIHDLHMAPAPFNIRPIFIQFFSLSIFRLHITSMCVAGSLTHSYLHWNSQCVFGDHMYTRFKV